MMESSCNPKSLNFSLLPDITPTKKLVSPVPPLITDHILGKKKVSIIAFRQILPRIFPATCIFSYAIKRFFKKLIGTLSLNTKQWTVGLLPRIIPHHPLEIYGKPWGCGKSPPNSENVTNFSHQKNPL